MTDQYTTPDFRKIALVTIDVQRDFLDDGVCAVPGTTAVLPHSLNADVLLTGELQQFGDNEWAMYESRWGAFYQTRLEDHLRSRAITTLAFTGCNFPNCPRTSIYEASAISVSCSSPTLCLGSMNAEGLNWKTSASASCHLRRVTAIQQKLDRLDEAFVFAEAIDATSYERQRDRLREEITLARIDHHDESIDELDVEGILAFAERILPRASDLLVQASLDQKQRLQQLFFPEGIAFDGNRFNRTAVTAPLFKYFGARRKC